MPGRAWPALLLCNVQVGASWCLAALHTLVATVTSCFDPLRRPGEVVCVKPDDAACTAALAQGNVCSLPREAWQWRET